MSKEPKDNPQKPKSSAAAPNASEPERQAEPNASNETAADVWRRAIANNPRFKEVKDMGRSYMFFGEHIYQQQKAFAIKDLVMALRPFEPPLGNLTLADQNWLTTALAHLIEIDESRRAENAHGNSYCIFEAGRAYFQCLAPSFGTYLRCESVSEKFIPEIGAILTPKKRDRLVREFGFTAPGYSKNFSQKIEVASNDDLAYVARMAFRVLRDIYNVTDFGTTKFKVSIPKLAKPVSI